MASYTQITWRKRDNRKKNMGRARKAALRNGGTTPVFPVHSEAAVANAPVDQLRPSDRKSD